MTSYNLRFIWPIFLGILFTIIFTWPLFLKINTFYTDKGDYPLVGWILWHNQKAITEGFIFDQIRYFDAGQFYPYSYSLAFSEHLFLPSILFSLFYIFTNNLVFSINILLFLSFVLSFLTSYFSINYFLKNKSASLIGALVFTFNPLTAAHFADHFHLMGKYFLPLVFLYLYLFLFKTNLKNALLFFIFFTLNFLTSIHFGVFSSITILILVSGVLIFQLFKRNYFYIYKLITLGILFLIFLPILFYFNLPYLEFSNRENVKRSLSEVSHYSARLIDWISPSKNLVYGQFVNKLEEKRNPKEPGGEFNYSEHTLSTNILPTALFLIGLIYCLKHIRKGKIIKFKTTLFFLTIAIISITFTLGPSFTGWNGKGGTILLPYDLFYKLLPMMQSIRVPTRFEFIFYFPFSFFVACGFYLIVKKFKRNLILLLIGLVLLLVENSQTWSLDARSKIIDQFNNGLKSQLLYLKDKNTLHVPFGLNNDLNESRYLTWSTLTGERIFNGYSGFAPKDRNNFINKFKDLDYQALEKLSAIGIDYLIFHKDLITDFKSFNVDKKLYETGKIFEDSNLFIVDLKKYNFNTKKCENRNNLSIQLISSPFLIRGVDENFYYFFNKIKVVNSSSCYFISRYRERYLPFKTRFEEDTIYLKLPILIEPGEVIETAI